jgi:beta-glucosidase
MKKTVIILAAAVCALAAATPADAQKLYFRDTSLTPEQRAEDVVARLSLEEKAAQMLDRAAAIPRLGIPAYNWWNECLHGVARTPYPVTSYPQAIAMAATWNPAAVHTMADQSSTEGRAIYNDAVRKDPMSIPQYHGLTYWTPNINIFRDPRWGRGQETYGEDPWLTASIGTAFVRGLQGDDARYLKSSACAKHYAVHSGPEWNRHTFDTEVTAAELWDTYLWAFRELVVEAGVTGVMTAYNRYAGQPMSMNDLLMTDVLYGKWNFRGYVTSDCGAINDIWRTHRTVPDRPRAAALAVAHGTHTDCGDNTYLSIVQAVRDGLIDEELVDRAVAKLFEIRIRMGMFDPAGSTPWDTIGTDVLESPAHAAHALDMARQSIVLMKNEASTLPLSKSVKKIAVVGPNADNVRTPLANYEGKPSHVTSALEGIRRKLGRDVEVAHYRISHWVTNDQFTDIEALAASLSDADAIVYVGGLSPEIEGEEMPVALDGFRGGDRTSIALPAIQTRTLKALKATGKPVVFVVMTGGAIAMPWESANIPAIVNAWYGGQAAGDALADVLFGDYNPSGRLPITFYESDADLPDYEDYSMRGRTYRYFAGRAVYRFGHGLSYTTFAYSDLAAPASISGRRGGEVSVTVKNTGTVEGDEVVQLYLSHAAPGGAASGAAASGGAATPLYALRGFEKVRLAPGESRRVTFRLTGKELAVVNASGDDTIRPGRMTVWTGGVSPSADAPGILHKTVILRR